MQHMYWFITISRKSDAEEIVELYKKLDVPRLYCTLARGTAKSQTLDLFGIEQSEKVVHQAVITHNKLYELKKTLETDFQIDLPDRGIALAVPLASISTKNTLDFFSGGHAEDEMTDTEQKEKSTMELIIVICNKGYTEDVMEAARKAGAGGGTILHAKGTGTEYAEKFLGISIVDEKEMIYIVSKKEVRNAILQAITDNAGAGTKAHALVFSLPVTETAGFRLYGEKTEA